MSIAYLLCTVLAISDGDTMKLTCKQHKAKFDMRLGVVDAPEIEHKTARPPIPYQRFGNEAKASLAALCPVGSTANLARTGFDQYHRALGRIRCNKIEAGSYQVEYGYAWVATKYAPKKSPLYKLQTLAQQQRRGLWVDLDSTTPPVQPWVWRGNKP